MKLRTILTLLFTTFSLLTYGQILNFEKDRADDEDENKKWIGSIGANYTLNNQQKTTINFAFNTNLAYRGEKNIYALITNLRFLEGDGESLISDGYVHARGIFFQDVKFSPEVFIQNQYDNIRGMENRLLMGGGLRFHIKEKEKYLLAVGIGAMYENERWQWDVTENEAGEFNGGIIQAGDQLNIHQKSLKSTNYIVFKWDITEVIYFNFISYYQAFFNDLAHPRISMESNLNFKFTKRLFFNNQFTLFHDAAPLVPIDETNYTLQSGIGWKF